MSVSPLPLFRSGRGSGFKSGVGRPKDPVPSVRLRVPGDVVHLVEHLEDLKILYFEYKKLADTSSPRAAFLKRFIDELAPIFEGDSL